MGGNLGSVTVDSPAVFDQWGSDSLWKDMLRRDDFSILLHLHPDWADTSLAVWGASFTVHKSSEKPTSANFSWDLMTGETTKSSF